MASFNPSLTFVHSINWGEWLSKFLYTKITGSWAKYVANEQPLLLPQTIGRKREGQRQKPKLKDTLRSYNWAYYLLEALLIQTWLEGQKWGEGNVPRSREKSSRCWLLGRNYACFRFREGSQWQLLSSVSALEEEILLEYQRETRIWNFAFSGPFHRGL